MSNAIVDRFKIIDTDTHLVEPPDLWTSRMSKKWGDLVPSVRWDDDAQEGRRGAHLRASSFVQTANIIAARSARKTPGRT